MGSSPPGSSTPSSTRPPRTPRSTATRTRARAARGEEGLRARGGAACLLRRGRARSLAVIGPIAGCSAERTPAEACDAAARCSSYQAARARLRVRRAVATLYEAARRARAGGVAVGPARGRRAATTHSSRPRSRQRRRSRCSCSATTSRRAAVGRPRQPRAARRAAAAGGRGAARRRSSCASAAAPRASAPRRPVLANVSALVAAFTRHARRARARQRAPRGALANFRARGWRELAPLSLYGRPAGLAGSGASPWRQWRVGKWVTNGGRRRRPRRPALRPVRRRPASPLFYFGHGLGTTFSFSGSPSRRRAAAAATAAACRAAARRRRDAR